jgi:hypothetical protein
MYFLVDEKNKIIFGWSAKCGCSHIKTIFNYLNDIESSTPHTQDTFNKLPENIEEYTSIIISRNPYKRIISGFLDKYKKTGKLRKLWKHPTITFTQFVNELMKKDYVMIEQHHFNPQTSEAFNIRILNSKSIKCYDIHHIDYSYFESLYNKKIPDDILNKKFGHERKINPKSINHPVYNLNMDTNVDYNVHTNYFYNDDLQKKVYYFYKQDFLFFEKLGIKYFFQKQRSTI